MNKQQNHDKGKILSLCLLIIWCLVIFYFSNQPGNISETSSDNFIHFFNSKIDLTNSKTLIYLVRKMAHMFLYFILYLLSYSTMLKYNLKKPKRLAFIFCLIYATSDEFHQLFIQGRTAKFLDILIDMFGSSIAILSIKLKTLFQKEA